MKSVSCNACGSSEKKQLFSHQGYTIVQCTSCGLGFVDPQPDVEDIRSFYAECYRREKLPTSSKEKAKLREAERTVRRIEYFIRKRKFLVIRHLDIGCGFGYLLAVSRRWGWESQGIDISKWQVTYAKKTFDVCAEVLPFPGCGLEKGKFQVITLLEVLEHLPDPRAALKECKCLLSESGLLFVKVPDFGHHAAVKKGVHWRGVVLPDHLYYFTLASLRKIAESVGLKYIGMFPRAPWRELFTAVFEK